MIRHACCHKRQKGRVKRLSQRHFAVGTGKILIKTPRKLKPIAVDQRLGGGDDRGNALVRKCFRLLLRGAPVEKNQAQALRHARQLPDRRQKKVLGCRQGRLLSGVPPGMATKMENPQVFPVDVKLLLYFVLGHLPGNNGGNAGVAKNFGQIFQAVLLLEGFRWAVSKGAGKNSAI